jgi:hypothetical protein
VRIDIELSPAQEEALRERARELGVPLETLARSVVIDLLTAPTDEIRAAIERLLQKNRDLYRRLS